MTNLELLQLDSELTTQVLHTNSLLEAAIKKFETADGNYVSPKGTLERDVDFYGNVRVWFNSEEVFNTSLGNQLGLLEYGFEEQEELDPRDQNYVDDFGDPIS